ncbi:DUF4625 domain-containing protein [Pedobacter insulae]|uniref:DUF4625 domain-containing protein n=1 Tax=Pedobacter insulae TaxID=414048 RepID=A0A1I2Y280_9SPHI|nr:DUF4625 domain-containing protein [Pedobacter insulae]SFH19745.1 protein of unknown function [Pedobacter insulae]
MKKFKKLVVLFYLIGIFAVGCKKDEGEVDIEYPIIDIAFADAFPIQCSTFTRGQTITFKAKFTDNAALGSYSLDIHHNFDHHSHSTEVSNCTAEAVKTPIKPFLLIKTFQIPAGQTMYEANNQLTIPADIDAGDYHFLIKLTDKEGWQTLKGISIKII